MSRLIFILLTAFAQLSVLAEPMPAASTKSPVRSQMLWTVQANDTSEYQTQALEQNQSVWNEQGFAAYGFVWDLDTLAEQGYIWQPSEEQTSDFKQQQAVASEQKLLIDLPGNNDFRFYFNMAGATAVGFIWNLSSPANAGFIQNP
ncbi:MAG TPA: hypothetical protein EYQ22_02835 [Gammaproteobacteria bacterium]|nr:hypothetical protein [Gammaproteobacteria bacterium]HIK69694.1 hypothetical protein [Pseudomonadales bacterium]